MRILGVDPGSTGAIVEYDGITLVALRPEEVKSTGKGFEINYALLAMEFDRLWPIGNLPGHAYVEKVGFIHGQGGSSSFKFGYSAGFMRGLVAAKCIPITMISPVKWKGDMGVRAPKGDKGPAVAKASALFPAYADLFAPKRGHWTKPQAIGVAEAALIAYYGFQKLRSAN